MRRTRRPMKNLIRRRCYHTMILSVLIGLIVEFMASHWEKSAWADVKISLLAAPGLGVLIYKSNHDDVCISCLQFGKPGPILRLNLFLDTKGKNFGLRIGSTVFAHLAFQSWESSSVDISSSRIAGLITLGPTYTFEDRKIEVAAGMSLGGSVQGDSVSVTNSLSITETSTVIYGGYVGVRFFLKPIVLGVEPLSIVYYRHAGYDASGQNKVTLDAEALWTPSAHIGYEW